MDHERFTKILAEAVAVGEIAAKAIVPVPMHVKYLDGRTNTEVVERVDDGVCGFGWVKFPDAREPFVKWLKANRKGHKGYPKGWSISAYELGAGHTQSMARNEVAAEAAALVFKNHGITAYAESRID